MKKKVIALIALGTLVLAAILIIFVTKKKAPEESINTVEQAIVSALKPSKRPAAIVKSEVVEQAKEDLGISTDSSKYTNPGFSVAYPSDFTENQNFVYKGMGPGNDITGVSFTIPSKIAKGTNLSADSYISFEHLNKIDCEAKDFLHGVSFADEDTVKINNVDFRTAHIVNGAAGNMYEETVFVSDDCRAIRYFIHSTNLANYEAGAVKAFDRDALITIFDDIRDSYRNL